MKSDNDAYGRQLLAQYEGQTPPPKLSNEMMATLTPAPIRALTSKITITGCRRNAVPSNSRREEF